MPTCCTCNPFGRVAKPRRPVMANQLPVRGTSSSCQSSFRFNDVTSAICIHIR